jgi:transposase
MYLRHSTVTKCGKTHTYWRLVRSVRMGRNVRQETVAMLGELDVQGRAEARALTRALNGSAPATPDLFESESPEAPVPVKLSEISLERGRRFGDVWLGWTLWRALKLDEWAGQRMPDGREDVAWPLVSSILVLARLCEPSSELHIAEDWYRRTALEDLLGIPAEKINEQRLYRGLDELLPHKDALTTHLKERVSDLFGARYDLLLYDMTSTYFEGLAKSNRLAKRGHSRDHRPDCKQVCIALVVTQEGFPLGYEVFAGNTADAKTLQRSVRAVEKKHGKLNRIWVMDRGMASEKNVSFLRKGKRQYVVATPKAMLKKLDRELGEKGWTEVQPGVEAKLCPATEDREVFILCRSEARREKERAMHNRFEKRIARGLASLERRLQRARKRVDRAQVDQQVGRLLGRNTRAAGGFDIRIQRASDRPGRLRVIWTRRPEWQRAVRLREGAYVLRSNVAGLTPEQFWKTYVQLTEAENAFRMHKSDLRLRPIWHQKTERVEAHILVCFLAYALYKTLEQWSHRAGLGKSPRTLLEELARIQTADVVLPTADGRELRVRCVVQPERAQAILLQRMGLELPRRMRIPPLG